MKPSAVPVDFIAVPDGSVAVQVVPLVLERLTDLVPVPLWYVAVTESVFERLTVAQVRLAASNVLRVNGVSEMTFRAKPATDTEQFPENAGAPTIVSVALGTA